MEEETPPLARRKRGAKRRTPLAKGNTSACAEKTCYRSSSSAAPGKHLRLRGENKTVEALQNFIQETPPLARRKLVSAFLISLNFGNTSACAEKTDKRQIKPMIKSETPPLARRKPSDVVRVLESQRNTSACAEKTTNTTARRIIRRKHLRLRGENLFGKMRQSIDEETPPLARRKRLQVVTLGEHRGNTSACAEKTLPAEPFEEWTKKHLRLRGENHKICKNSTLREETPPLARRKLVFHFFTSFFLRNTSACAEKTMTVSRF